MSQQPDWLSMLDRTSLPDETASLLDGAKIKRVEVRQRSREITVVLEVSTRISLAQRNLVAIALATSCFPDISVVLRVVCEVISNGVDPSTAITEAWADLKYQVKADFPRLTGIIDQAVWHLEARVLCLELQTASMVDLAQNCGFEARLADLVRQETGYDLTIRLSSPPPVPKAEPIIPPMVEDPFADLDEEGIPLPPEPSAADSQPDHAGEYFDEWMQRQSAFGKKEALANGSAGNSTADRLLKGKAIPADAVIREIQSINEEENRVLIEGEVVQLDARELKTGRQLISFGLCDLLRSSRTDDLGDTLPIKLFRDPKKDPDFLALIKTGSWLKVRGNVQVDKFSGELTMLADDIHVGTRPSRFDSYSGRKRVELHAHTTMSAMDGMIDPEELVKLAIKWGHSGVAVTDHGVTQAFPAASHVKVPKDFKLLYGCEFYLVDDGTPIVVRSPSGLPYGDAEFVVLDVETTGFSPIGDDIIEVGAVRFKNGVIGESFQRFVRPTKVIPEVVQKLTGITPEMVQNAPRPEVALQEFFEFIGDSIVVAHNAQFDHSFLRYHRQKYLGSEFLNPVLDTLILGRALLPNLKSHSLSALTKELQISLVDHHRADSDARTAAMVLTRLLERAGELTTVEALNDLTAGMNVEQLRPHHVTCLVKTQSGMKNLYKLITKSHTEYYNRTPRVPRTELERHRQGLLIGSSTYGGALFDALMRGVPDHELEQVVQWYDYLEILPRDCLQYLLADGQLGSEAQLLELNRRIYELGKRMGKPVCAVSDAHFVDPYQRAFRRILKGGIGFRDEHDSPFYFRTTQEMLDEFQYLGEDAAIEVVITNTNAIADLVDHVKPVPDKLFPPVLDGSDTQTREVSYAKAYRIYGNPLPEKVEARLERELQAIIGNGFAVSYYISYLLVKRSSELGYLVGSRGSVGSSFVAWAMDITEVNALQPHYVCTACKYIEWHDDGKTGSGYDLPRKACPTCGAKDMYRDGQDIPFETFLGFKGDKVPDIDLNFSGEVQGLIQKYSEELLGGEKYVFKAGTVGTIAEKTAYGMVKGWLEDNSMVGLREAHVGYLAAGVAGVKRTTGQHPGGMVVVPVGMEIEEVTPVQHPADDKNSGVKTTHYDYHSFEQALMKLDILGHDDPTMLRMLQDLYREKLGDPAWDIRSVAIEDSEVMKLFSRGGHEPLGIPKGKLQFDLGTIVLPEMGTRFVRQMLLETGPRNFSDLVRISGLSHGTDVWTNNAQDLIKAEICNLQTCIACRDDIMIYLMYQGMEPGIAFQITESVRKGRGVSPEHEEAMKTRNVPEWYIQSCKTIKYMFPKAHAAAYVLSCLRIAWFKVYEPLLFYATYFSVRAGAVDAELITRGPDAVRRHIQEIEAKAREATPKEKESLMEYELVEEAFYRQVRFAKVDLYRSAATTYLIRDNSTLLCPFNSLAGLGDNAANAIVEARKQGEFVSIDDLKSRARVNKSVIELLTTHGCLNGMPEGNQLVFGF